MSTGYLQIFTLSAESGIPVADVKIRITQSNGGVITETTDETGYSDPIELDAPDPSYSLDPDNTSVRPYSVVDITAEKEGWQNATIKNVQIFATQNALTTFQMQPQQEGARAVAEDQTYDIPAHGLFADNSGSGPTPKVYCNVPDFILREVVVPKNIIVHLGKPTSSAKNVTVPFIDYIKNVCSSEIYPTWPKESLKANIYAQISLALNRIFTEWYPSKGYSFNITNSTSYDQYFVYGRNIFDSISEIVDDIFNVYVRTIGDKEPYYTEYCDGKIVTSCPGMKQWGTVTLANQGKTAFQILQYYYGTDKELVTCNNIASIPQSYPGTPLRLGSTGTDVSIMQRQLNRIAKNYPSFGSLEANGTFDSATESTVKKFQKQFSLTADGVVGKSTWYKISYIYVAVKKLAELGSEGEQADGIPPTGNYPGTAIRQGDTGPNVKRVQFFLSVISQFDPAIPNVVVDGIFGAATTAAVRAFQTENRISVDGVVGATTWAELYADFTSAESDIAPPSTDWVGQYPGFLLKVGSKGNEVRLAQFFITVISDFYSDVPQINPDGIFGNATQAAVVAFQNRFSLTADGIIGKVTWDKLFEVYSGSVNSVIDPNETPGVYPGTPLRRGDSGQKVKEVQFYLYLLSAYYSEIPTIAYDGNFGAATETAVRAYQSLAGLVVDGVVGEVTWNSIYSSVIRLRNIDGPIFRYKVLPYPGYVVKEGMSGNEVKFIQYTLTLLDIYYPPIPETDIDGFYGPTTTESVKAFQSLFSLPVTGEVDATTWAALDYVLQEMLNANNSVTPETYTGEYPGYVLGPESAGAAVSELQYYINQIAERYCYSNFISEVGWYGPQTEQAVKEFQAGFGLPVTGIVDETTWNVIIGFYLELRARSSNDIKILVYNEYDNKMYTFYRGLEDPMPYSTGTTLRVREFRGSSKSPTLWTTTYAMESWNITRRTYGSAIPVGYAFKRLWEGGHSRTSQHYAGVAFDVGQKLTAAQRNQIWKVANDLGVWKYVEPQSMTPTWVHFDRRYGTPACGGSSGYPTVRNGSRSTYVLILQDCLNALGYSTKTLDGIFGANTETALKAYQRNNGLTADGVCGCQTWTKITTETLGIGRTPTVID